MNATLDHVVLWTEDPLASLEFYERVVGFSPVRAEEFKAGEAPFPSVRISPHSIVDLMSKAAAPLLDGLSGVEGSAGNRVNHLCFSVSKSDLLALTDRLKAGGVPMSMTMENSYGAQGPAPQAFYFRDLDGNVLEARTYEP